MKLFFLIIPIVFMSFLLFLWPEGSQYEDQGWSYQHKFGENDDVDSGPEDIWDAGGLYPWPSSAEITTAESTSEDDKEGGSGAQAIALIGLRNDLIEISEIITLSGTTVVTFNNQFFRTHRVQNRTTGITGTNVGDILIKHGNTTIAQITAGNGQTLMAVYTIPAQYRSAELCRSYASIVKFTGASTSVATLSLFVRPISQSWQIRDRVSVVAGGPPWDYSYGDCVDMNVGDDIRWEVTNVSSMNTAVVGIFDIRQKR